MRNKNQFVVGKYIFLMVFFFLLLFNASAIAQPGGIVDGPKMRLAANHTFTANPSGAGGTIQWKVDRLTRTELSSSGSFSRTANVYTASGPSAAFDLTYTSGKETKYDVIASDAGFVDTLAVQVFPSNTRASFMYESAGNPRVPVYVIVPSTLSSASHLISIFHGSGRNGDEYINYWSTWVAANNYIAICPTFSDANWPGARSYNEGNMFTGSDGSGSLNPESKWSFTISRDVVIKVLADFGLQDTQCDAWGHSAGGQFTHRLLIFRPDFPVRYMMPANPGWWTLPVYNTTDPNYLYPYGPYHPLLSYTAQDVLDWTNRVMIIFRGTADVIRDGSLRTTPEADFQGLNRYERAGFAYSKAVQLNPNTLWELHDVIGVGHDGNLMSVDAKAFLEAHPWTPPVQYTLTTSTAGAGTGTVTLNPAGGTYNSGTVVTVTANANLGSAFNNWSGALSGSTNPTTITMDGNKSVTANFVTVPTYTLTVNTAGEGSGTVTLNPSGGVYNAGTVVTITANANTGSEFTSWSGALSGSTNPTTITMDGNKSVTANFAIAQWVQLKYDDFEAGFGNYTDGGTNCLRYTGGSTYAHQGAAAIDIQSYGTSSLFTLTNGINVTGYNQIEIDFWFKTNSMESGEDFWVQYYDGTTWNTVASYVSGTDFSNGTFYHKQVYVYSFQYTFPSAMKIRFVCDASATDDDVYIDEVKISASALTVPTYALTVNTAGEGAGTVSLSPSGGTYISGTVVTLTANPDSVSMFSSWSGALTGSTNPTTITMDADKSVTANFVVSPWTQLTFDNFETGFGNYTDDGSDCLRYTGGSTYAHQGTAALDIQDNTTTSMFTLTNGINVTSYNQIQIDFWFKTNSMESGEDFWVQYYDGAAWNTVASYVSGTDFSNGTFYHKQVYVSSAQYTFPTAMKVRFVCDASADDDDVYIDEVKISATTNLMKSAGQTDQTIAAKVEIPKEFGLLQNFPNPFNPTTNIKFSIPEYAFVSLKIYNTLGQEVATLLNEFKSAGTYQVDFNASNLSSGMYIYTLTSGKYKISKKMLLMK